jgi:hypothetical protein
MLGLLPSAEPDAASDEERRRGWQTVALSEPVGAKKRREDPSVAVAAPYVMYAAIVRTNQQMAMGPALNKRGVPRLMGHIFLRSVLRPAGHPGISEKTHSDKLLTLNGGLCSV